jgi:hypothetical protein
MKIVIAAVSGLVVGLVVGVLIMVLLFVGFSRSSKPTATGTPIQPPDTENQKAETAFVTINEPFFSSILNSIFKDMNTPSFPLQSANEKRDDEITMSFALQQSDGCDRRVFLLQEGSGVKTGVQFRDGKIAAPLAFKGSYNLFGACINFTGWADTKIGLRFDESKQTVFGQLEVESINLDGALAVAGSVLKPIIQETINNHVNPIEILNAKQLTLAVPIKNANGTLNAKVKDVRAETKDGQMRLFITYDFKGEKN